MVNENKRGILVSLSNDDKVHTYSIWDDKIPLRNALWYIAQIDAITQLRDNERLFVYEVNNEQLKVIENHIKQTVAADSNEFLNKTINAEIFPHAIYDKSYSENKYRAIETNQGVSLFSNTDKGNISCQNFLKKIEREYFNPETKIEYLRTYDLNDLPPEYLKNVDQTESNNQGQTCGKDALKYGIQSADYCMMPTWYNYIAFTVKEHLDPTNNSNNIFMLKLISEFGYIPEMMESERTNSFTYKQEFESLRKNMVTSKTPKEAWQIDCQIKQLAKTYLGKLPHRDQPDRSMEIPAGEKTDQTQRKITVIKIEPVMQKSKSKKQIGH